MEPHKDTETKVEWLCTKHHYNMSDSFTSKKMSVGRDASGLSPNTLRSALSHIQQQQEYSHRKHTMLLPLTLKPSCFKAQSPGWSFSLPARAA